VRVIVAHAVNPQNGHQGLYRETVSALAEHCPVEPRFVDVSARPDAYFDLLAAEWADTRDNLVLVEHDIVVHDQVFAEFTRCRRPWCAYPYMKGGSILHGGLGCTRFRAGMLAATAGVWARVARHGNDADIPDGVPARHWLRCDVRLDAELMPLGYRPHLHWPEVGHLNPR